LDDRYRGIRRASWVVERGFADTTDSVGLAPLSCPDRREQDRRFVTVSILMTGSHKNKLEYG